MWCKRLYPSFGRGINQIRTYIARLDLKDKVINVGAQTGIGWNIYSAKKIGETIAQKRSKKILRNIFK
jgi:hypothetical protein